MGATMSGNASATKAPQTKANYNILQTFNEQQQQCQTKPQVIVKTPHEKCKDILDELSILEKDVECFGGIKNDKAYLKLEELLTRCLLKLDEIDRGDEQINLNRKNMINYTHTLTEKLEVIATENANKEGLAIENASPQNITNDSEKTVTLSEASRVNENDLIKK